jgi:hypothetical protein
MRPTVVARDALPEAPCPDGDLEDATECGLTFRAVDPVRYRPRPLRLALCCDPGDGWPCSRGPAARDNCDVASTQFLSPRRRLAAPVAEVLLVVTGGRLRLHTTQEDESYLSLADDTPPVLPIPSASD